MTETKIDLKAVRAAKPMTFLSFAVGKLSYFIPNLPVLNRRGGSRNRSQMNFNPPRRSGV
jgi:hypothetical protein